MKPIDSEEQPGESLKKVLGGLEHIAGELDYEQFPGQAWPASRTARSGGFAWRIAFSILATAALMMVAFHGWGKLPGPSHAAPRESQRVARITAPSRKTPLTTSPLKVMAAQSSLSGIVIVEDMDSYSIIDMTGDVPLVSFARKDSTSFDDATPMFIEPFSEAATRNAPL